LHGEERAIDKKQKQEGERNKRTRGRQRRRWTGASQQAVVISQTVAPSSQELQSASKLVVLLGLLVLVLVLVLLVRLLLVLRRDAPELLRHFPPAPRPTCGKPPLHQKHLWYLFPFRLARLHLTTEPTLSASPIAESSGGVPIYPVATLLPKTIFRMVLWYLAIKVPQLLSYCSRHPCSPFPTVYTVGTKLSATQINCFVSCLPGNQDGCLSP
jgi:hypothetical protein